MQQKSQSPEGRFFLAIALTFAFLFVWFNFFAPKPAKKELVGKTVPNPALQSSSETQGLQVDANALDVSEQQSTSDSVKPLPIETKNVYPRLKPNFETSLFKLDFDSMGGGLSSVVSKKHFKTKGSNEGVELLAPSPSFSMPVSWIWTINAKAIEDQNLSFSVNNKGNSIEFSNEIMDKVFLYKKYTWNEQDQKIKHSVRIENQSSVDFAMQPSLRMAGKEEPSKKSKFSFFSPQVNKVSGLAFISDSVKRWGLSSFGTKEDPSTVPEGGIDWIGFDKQYFLLSALPKEGRWDNVKPVAGPTANEGSLIASYPQWNLEAGQSKSYMVDLYVGPKDILVLEQEKASLEKAIDLGSWLGPIARPILRFLKFLYGIFPNYGVAIILLTFLVRLLMFPLTQVQAKSMKKMSLHKPQMDALKETYKDDREAYSRELMTYMRKNKINPAGGCFLLALQMPVFFALYRVLYNSIELRHAPFFLWIKDLSAYDPFFVLPVLLGISMFFQQKLTPTAGVDPAKQAMMKFIPLMFTVFMIFLPAGLNIYILVSTLWGVAQQYWIQKSVVTLPA